MVLVQVGGGEVWGLTTGAKALFCFTAETMLAGEKEKMPEELLQLEGRLVEEAMVGLDGTTGRGRESRNQRLSWHPDTGGSEPTLTRPPFQWEPSLNSQDLSALIIWYLVCAAFRWW